MNTSLLLALSLTLSHALTFETNLLPIAARCYSEELPSDTLVLTEVIPAGPASPVTLLVHSRWLSEDRTEQSKTYVNQTSAKSMQMAITTEHVGYVDVCVRNDDVKTSKRVVIRVLSGAFARDFTQVAKKAHFDPLIQELRSVEEHLHDYLKRQIHLSTHMSNVHQVVDRTHTRVLTLAAANVAVLILATMSVVVSLRSFFRAKKLI